MKLNGHLGAKKREVEDGENLHLVQILTKFSWPLPFYLSVTENSLKKSEKGCANPKKWASKVKKSLYPQDIGKKRERVLARKIPFSSNCTEKCLPANFNFLFCIFIWTIIFKVEQRYHRSYRLPLLSFLSPSSHFIFSPNAPPITPQSRIYRG